MTRARLIAAGVDIRPGMRVRDALKADEIERGDPLADLEARLRSEARERGPDGNPTTRAVCAALRLACGSVEQAAATLGMSNKTVYDMIRADKVLALAKRDGAAEGKRLFEQSMYTALRAGDTGALALWARYYGHRVGVCAAGEGGQGGTAGRMGGDGGGFGAGGELIDLGREVRGLLDVTDRELVEALRAAGGGGVVSSVGAPGSAARAAVPVLSPGDLASGLSLAARECLRGAAGAGAGAGVPVPVPVPVPGPGPGPGSGSVPAAVVDAPAVGPSPDAGSAPSAPALGAGGLWSRVLRSGGGKV